MKTIAMKKQRYIDMKYKGVTRISVYRHKVLPRDYRKDFMREVDEELFLRELAMNHTVLGGLRKRFVPETHVFVSREITPIPEKIKQPIRKKYI